MAGSGAFAARRKAWGVSYQGMPHNSSPWWYDVRTGSWDLKKTAGANPFRGNTTLGAVLVYVPKIRKLFFFAGYDETAFYDPATNAWEVQKNGALKPPFGIDAVACLDTQRNRIYCGGTCGKANPFWYFDLASKSWVDPQPQGLPFKGENHFTTNESPMNYDSVNGVVVLNYHRGNNEDRGIYIYDPKTNAWAADPLALPEGFYPGKWSTSVSSFYSAELNAHFFYVAGDSADDGIMWVYRYKRAK